MKPLKASSLAAETAGGSGGLTLGSVPLNIDGVAAGTVEPQSTVGNGSVTGTGRGGEIEDFDFPIPALVCAFATGCVTTIGAGAGVVLALAGEKAVGGGGVTLTGAGLGTGGAENALFWAGGQTSTGLITLWGWVFIARTS